MTDFRIVFNEQTGRYRVEQRRWWGWDFVRDPAGEGYLTFESLAGARRFVCGHLFGRPAANRRWRVVDPCCQAPPAA